MQYHWVFGLCLSSGIPETRKLNVSETGPVPKRFVFYFLEYQMVDRLQKSSDCVVHHRQNPLESNIQQFIFFYCLILIILTVLNQTFSYTQ